MPKNSSVRRLPEPIEEENYGLPWQPMTVMDQDLIEADDGLDLVSRARLAAETGEEFSLKVPLDL